MSMNTKPYHINNTLQKNFISNSIVNYVLFKVIFKAKYYDMFFKWIYDKSSAVCGNSVKRKFVIACFLINYKLSQ